MEGIRASMWNWRPVVFVLLPFGAGYFLSYLFRTINALISAQLTAELGLSAAGLGLLTSAYFLTFAAAQLPIGVSLDHYGPRRIQGSLLLVAAAGAALFGFSPGIVPLVFARGLIGLGVAGALPSGFKALALWFPKQRLALANGCMIMLGALGAVTATAPAELVLGLIGWRGLFECLAIICAAGALIIFFVVPEAKPLRPTGHSVATIGLKAIWTDARFWRLAPLSATCVGTSWGLQGLWAAPWLADVDGLERPAIVRHLFVMGLALSVGALLMGISAERLRAQGIRPHYGLAFVATLSVVVQFALILRVPISSQLCWALVSAAGAAPVLSYASLAEYFPKEVTGRANGALGVIDIGGAFLLQSASGLVLQQWPSMGGHYPAIAYQTAFGINVLVGALALVWFVLPAAQKRILALACYFLRPVVDFNQRIQELSIYDWAARLWAAVLIAGRQETVSWQSAALGSIMVSALLGIALAISSGRANVVTYVVEPEAPRQVVTARVATPTPDLQFEPAVSTRTVFSPELPGTNMISPPTDFITLRERWLAIYDYSYLGNREPEASNGYAGVPASERKSIGPGSHRKTHTWRRHGSH